MTCIVLLFNSPHRPMVNSSWRIAGGKKKVRLTFHSSDRYSIEGIPLLLTPCSSPLVLLMSSVLLCYIVHVQCTCMYTFNVETLMLPFILTHPLLLVDHVMRQFGLSQPLVVQLIEQLPNVEKCSRHTFRFHLPENLTSWQALVSFTLQTRV